MKKYLIQEKEFSLAPQTSKRLSAYCEIAGITDFAEIADKEQLEKLGKRLLTISKDSDEVKKILSACLLEDVSEVDSSDVDLIIVDEIFNDFFSQRFLKLQKQESTS